jgi:nucleoside-diphosphate-sugar epimerase
MSVLLAGLEAELAAVLTRRLVEEGDQVRAIVRPGGEVAPPGAHAAAGDLTDEDLVERACQGVRTIVLGEVTEAERAAALVAAARAGTDRAVFVGTVVPEAPGGMSWVALLVPRPRLLGRRKGISPEDLAEAIDAADDLAGDPRLVADLGTAEGWAALRLERRG